LATQGQWLPGEAGVLTQDPQIRWRRQKLGFFKKKNCLNTIFTKADSFALNNAFFGMIFPQTLSEMNLLFNKT